MGRRETLVTRARRLIERGEVTAIEGRVYHAHRHLIVVWRDGRGQVQSRCNCIAAGQGILCSHALAARYLFEEGR